MAQIEVDLIDPNSSNLGIREADARKPKSDKVTAMCIYIFALAGCLQVNHPQTAIGTPRNKGIKAVGLSKPLTT